MNEKKKKERIKETMNYLGMCGMTGLTEQATKNVEQWLGLIFDISYAEGDRAGYKEGFESVTKIYEKNKS